MIARARTLARELYRAALAVRRETPVHVVFKYAKSLGAGEAEAIATVRAWAIMSRGKRDAALARMRRALRNAFGRAGEPVTLSAADLGLDKALDEEDSPDAAAD